jgi:hypothetical protein
VRADAPVVLPASGPPHFAAGAARLREWGANALSGRVAQMGDEVTR